MVGYGPAGGPPWAVVVVRTDDPIVIRGLPDDLAVVPLGADGPDDPLAAEKRDAWLAWRDRLIAYRAEVRRHTAGHGPDVAVLRLLERQLCADDPAYFVAVWCSIYEPRTGWGRVSGWQPAVPYPFQVAMIRWLEERLDSTGPAADGLISKSRDMGATWFCCLFALHGWLFRAPFSAKLVSRREDLVDNASIDSMFGRITTQFDHLRGKPAGNPDPIPDWLLPPGFEPAQHKTALHLAHPGSANEINGESTSSRTGRGGRVTVVFPDELAFIPDANLTWGTLAATAGHRIGLSSESIEVSAWFAETVATLKAANSPSLLELDHWLHPFHDAAWLAAERARYEEAGLLDAFYREVMRDAASGLTTWAYQWARDHAALGDFPYVAGSAVWVTIDPGFDDECAVHWLSRDPYRPERVRLLRSYVNRGKPPEFYAALIGGVPRDELDDPSLPWRFGVAEQDAIEWVRSLPVRPAFVYGDPAGGNRVTGQYDSWYARMTAYWAANGWAKAVTYKGLMVDPRPFQVRRTALMKLLPLLDFHDGPGVAETLRAIQESRFDQNDDRVTEQKALRHDKHSHRRSALEFFAVLHPKVSGRVEGQSYKPLKRKAA